jgi:LysR family hca operon transcriptional activator
MELRHLRYFIAVAEEGSLTLAAVKRLHTAQPSLSRQIRDLEYEVGVELMSRSVHGIELTDAGKAFLDHARLALAQVEAAVELARKAGQPARKTFAIGFQTGLEVKWLPRAMHVLRDEMKNIQITITSDYSPDLAEALVRGRLDVAFMRVEPNFDLCYEVVDHEPLIVLMPSDHHLTSRKEIHPREFVGEIFIGGANKAAVLQAVTEDYVRRSGLDIKLDHGVDNMAMAMSPVASTRGLALMPAYAKNLLPWSVVSRPLEGEAPTIDVAVGYSKANTSPILKLFLSRVDESSASRGSSVTLLMKHRGHVSERTIPRGSATCASWPLAAARCERGIFDSAILRFESWRPSCRACENSRHFRALGRLPESLAGKPRRHGAKPALFGRQSLLAFFQFPVSVIRRLVRQWARTGSTLPPLRGGAARLGLRTDGTANPANHKGRLT